MIFLFTDYGWQGPWIGQVHGVLACGTDPPRVIDLMHDAPAFRPHAAAHLLAALAADLPPASICVAVVDPGVGTERMPVVVEANGRWFVGPGNGLFDVLSARSDGPRWWRITREPERDCATFHGRDLFAPVALELAAGEPLPGTAIAPPHAGDAGDDLPAVIYLDAFGNAATGLRAGRGDTRHLVVGQHVIARGRTFADAAPGSAMWLVNSLGLVEIVCNQASAARALGLDVGTPVSWETAA